MVIVTSPKGWTGIKELDGVPIEGTCVRTRCRPPTAAPNPDHLAAVEEWLRSYRVEELVDLVGAPGETDVLALCPTGQRRMGSNPHALGGAIRVPLRLPAVEDTAVPVDARGVDHASALETVGAYLASVVEDNATARNFRIVSPDELESNKLGCRLDVTTRAYEWPLRPVDIGHGRDGRVLEMLSEHNCQGWLEGYILTGRHGLFPSYEAFVEIVTGMTNQLAKFFKVARELPWRPPVSSFNYLLTSEGWRQEHNGYSHQGPGFINAMLNKKASVSRIYLPPDANTLLTVMERCLSSTNSINLVVAAKQPLPQWLTIDEARAHCEAGASVWEWAGSAGSEEPEIVFVCAGAIPTVETLAAVQLLRQDLPNLATRVVNVVDLLALAEPGRPSTRPQRGGVLPPLHRAPSGGLLLPRLSDRGPRARAPSTGPGAVPRWGLRRGGHDGASVPTVDRQRREPLRPRDPRAAACVGPREHQWPADRGVHQAHPLGECLHQSLCYRSARDHGVDLGKRAPVKVLAVNPGSSMLRLAVVDDRDDVLAELAEAASVDQVVPHLLRFVERAPAADVAGVRLVHGGALVRAPTLLDRALRSQLDALVDLAPLHDLAVLHVVDALREVRPDLPIVLCVDTAFHATIPAAAATYAIPWEWTERGARKYGFHGLSHRWASRRAAELVGRPIEDLRMVTCHLGSGASLAAIREVACPSTRRWASPPPTASSWRPGPVRWIPEWSRGSSAPLLSALRRWTSCSRTAAGCSPFPAPRATSEWSQLPPTGAIAGRSSRLRSWSTAS